MIKVFGNGRLTKDIELRYTQSEKAVLSNSIASREGKDQTEFVNIVAWGKLAEMMKQYLSKGSMISFTGRLQSRSYEQDGVKKYTTEIILNDVEFMDSKKDGAKSDQSSEKSGGFDVPDTNFEDNDLPF
jgi:single-strand DNA-binding protein